jgi:hypothetical protein
MVLTRSIDLVIDLSLLLIIENIWNLLEWKHWSNILNTIIQIWIYSQHLSLNLYNFGEHADISSLLKPVDDHW